MNFGYVCGSFAFSNQGSLIRHQGADEFSLLPPNFCSAKYIVWSRTFPLLHSIFAVRKPVIGIAHLFMLETFSVLNLECCVLSLAMLDARGRRLLPSIIDLFPLVHSHYELKVKQLYFQVPN
ncbi:hypothetical protein Pfo_002828, partial [Paulownia fortunei]